MTTTVGLPRWQRAERIRIGMQTNREYARALKARCARAEADHRSRLAEWVSA